jgi:hypothetical protein
MPNWKPAVIADSSGKWSYNAVVFATQEEALASARDLMARWTLVTDCAAHETDDPVNYHIDMETMVLSPVSKQAAA